MLMNDIQMRGMGILTKQFPLCPKEIQSGVTCNSWSFHMHKLKKSGVYSFDQESELSHQLIPYFYIVNMIEIAVVTNFVILFLPSKLNIM